MYSVKPTEAAGREPEATSAGFSEYMKKILILIEIGFLIVIAFLTFKVFKTGQQPLTIEMPAPPKTKTAYEITLDCQKIAATQNNKDWSYKSCLNELIKANKLNREYSL